MLKWIIEILLGVVIFFILVKLQIFSEIEIIFYRGIVVAIVAFVMQLIFLYLTRKSLGKASTSSRSSIISIASLAFSFNICFLIIFPVTFERSVTTFLLEEIQNNKDGLTERELTEILVSKYVISGKAVEKRMIEQTITGNVECELIESESERRCRLTKEGVFFMSFKKWVEKWWGFK